MALRSVVFWMHLALGSAAGAVVLVMSVTGVALSFEKQAIEWTDRRSLTAPLPTTGSLPPETLLESVAAAAGAAPAAITERADPRAPISVMLSDGRVVLVDGRRGTILGESAPRLRAFFRTTTVWHRYLALDGASRTIGRAVTGAANLAFLALVLSGISLWLPREWTRARFAAIAWFRRGLTAKARDFNWHHVVGAWAAIPLAVVIAGAVPISYPWASDLVYRVMGEASPARPDAGRSPASDGRGGRGSGAPSGIAAHIIGLDAAWTAAKAHHVGWRAISARVTAADAPWVLTIDDGTGGQPQRRGTLTVDRTTGAVRSWERFDDLSAGRRARSWLRFAHTGEFYGLAGQALAGLVSAGSAVLVYTGVALATRRGAAWWRRRQPAARSRAA